MNIENFSEFKTGQLIPLEGKKSWAFVPNPLPPKWEMSERLWLLIGEARQAVGDLNGSGNRLPNPPLLLRPLQRREALRSSSLEGTHATPKELLLFEKMRKKAGADESSDKNQWREVHNYYTVIRLGHQLAAKGHPFDRELFCRLHKALMKGVRGENKNPGEIRTQQVHVSRFTPPPPSELSQCLSEFENYLAIETDGDPLVRAFIAHYHFEAIHPFADGNGRIGRVILSLMITKWLGLSHPWLYLSEFFENNRSDYMNCLFRISTHGEWDEWIELCARATIEQAGLSIDRCTALENLKKEYRDKVSGENPRLHLIIELLFASPLLYVVEVRDKLKITYPTARDDMLKLKKLGVVSELEDEHPKMYSADRILEIAYDD